MSDYLFLLQSRLTPDQLEALVQVQRAAERAQALLFLAGGAMRDLLAGLPIRDLDFSVEGPALKLVRALDRRLFTVLSTDESRQSAELLYGASVTAEIAMCRRERYSKTGGQPEISRASIQDDLLRRDFSVNAIAISLNPASRGLLLDPANGLADLERKELRTLHNYTFFDDPARLLRLVRFKVRLQFAIEEKTQTQFESARSAGVEEYISPRSRLLELRQVAAEQSAAEVVRALGAAGLLGVFEPHLQTRKVDLAVLARLDKRRRLMEDSGIRVDNFGPFLYCLTRKLTSAERANMWMRAGLRGAQAKAWTGLEGQAKALQRMLAGKPAAQASKLHRMLSGQDASLMLFLMAFSPLQPVRERIKNYLTKLRPIAQGLDEREIQELGLTPDTPRYTRLREAYLAARLDNKVKSKADVARLLSAER